jgi:phage/plasmid-associated DNA primase
MLVQQQRYDHEQVNDEVKSAIAIVMLVPTGPMLSILDQGISNQENANRRNHALPEGRLEGRNHEIHRNAIGKYEHAAGNEKIPKDLTRSYGIPSVLSWLNHHEN